MANPAEVYVRNLSYSTGTEALAECLKQFGEVSQARIITARVRGEIVSRCFGFVEFKSAESAQAAIAAKNVELDGKRIFITRSRPKRERLTAYLGRLTEQITKEDIQAVFAAQNPTSIIIKNKEINGKLTNIFAFVKFPTAAALTEAIKDRQEVDIKGVKVLVKIARSRGPYRRGRFYRGRPQRGRY